MNKVETIGTAEIEMTMWDVSTDGDIVDSLGAIRAKIADLKAAEKFLEDLLKSKHVESADGSFYHVKIAYDATRKTVAWKKVAEHFKPSRQLLTAHTSETHFDRVTVTARKKS